MTKHSTARFRENKEGGGEPIYATQQPTSYVSALAEALEELIDLMEDTRQGEYTPDSFTTQPARIALAAYRKGGEPMADYKLTQNSVVDELAQFIRQVDGSNKMGASVLAEKICERFRVRVRVDAPAAQDVAGLVEALGEMIDVAHMVDSFPYYQIERAEEAIRAYRKGGDQ